MITLKTTKDLSAPSVKLLVYGQAGTGKTTLIKTAPSPIVLSAEAGLLSLSGTDIPYVEIHSMVELAEAGNWLVGSAEARAYKTVCLDSISEIAEVCLAESKAALKDGRAAYGEMNERMSRLIRLFRDLPDRHVYFTAKLEKSENEIGALMFAPSMPGKTLTQSLPYFFDEVFAMRLVADENKNTVRALMCAPDAMWTAKDRSGKLAPWEPADLGKVIAKIGGNAPAANEETAKESEK